MSAELNTSMSWYWYCADCGDGSIDFDSEDAAALERDEHNEEEHA